MSIEYAGKNDFDQDKYVIKVNGVIVGYIAVDYDLQSIMNIFVDPLFRNHDYGTELVRHIESLFLGEGLKILYTNPVNDGARGFFERLNFKIDEAECGSKSLSTER
jgi:ribosomal protein S18 acetylase RimI-like enzyme